MGREKGFFDSFLLCLFFLFFWLFVLVTLWCKFLGGRIECGGSLLLCLLMVFCFDADGYILFLLVLCVGMSCHASVLTAEASVKALVDQLIKGAYPVLAWKKMPRISSMSLPLPNSFLLPPSCTLCCIVNLVQWWNNSANWWLVSHDRTLGRIGPCLFHKLVFNNSSLFGPIFQQSCLLDQLSNDEGPVVSNCSLEGAMREHLTACLESLVLSQFSIS